MVEGDRAVEDVAEPGLVRVLALGPLVDLDAGLGGQGPERLRERRPSRCITKLKMSPPEPAPEALPRLAQGVTTNEGVFSPWNGHRPLKVVPAFLSVTVSPTTSTTPACS